MFYRRTHLLCLAFIWLPVTDLTNQIPNLTEGNLSASVHIKRVKGCGVNLQIIILTTLRFISRLEIFTASYCDVETEIFPFQFLLNNWLCIRSAAPGPHYLFNFILQLAQLRVLHPQLSVSDKVPPRRLVIRWTEKVPELPDIQIS